jgi:hypothetical protein
LPQRRCETEPIHKLHMTQRWRGIPAVAAKKAEA